LCVVPCRKKITLYEPLNVLRPESQDGPTVAESDHGDPRIPASCVIPDPRLGHTELPSNLIQGEESR
jgi:hypothetical protein